MSNRTEKLINAVMPTVIKCKKQIKHEDELIDFVIEEFKQSDYWKNTFPKNIDDNDINYIMTIICIKEVVKLMLKKLEN